MVLRFVFLLFGYFTFVVNSICVGTCNSLCHTTITALTNTFYNTFNLPSNWFTVCDYCTWSGVSCNSQKAITQLSLSGRNLRGNVDFSRLPTTVSRVYLYANQLSGSVNLTHLPSSLSVLQLYRNNFSGSVIFTSLPSSLNELYMEYNKLSGSADLTKLPGTLYRLRLNNNAFSGSLDLTRLPYYMQTLRADNNEFSGTLNLTRLPTSHYWFHLHLHNNSFSGTVQINLRSNMRELFLENNQIVGPVLFNHVRDPSSGSFSLRLDRDVYCDSVNCNPPRVGYITGKRTSYSCTDTSSCFATCNFSYCVAPAPTRIPTLLPSFSPTKQPSVSPLTTSPTEFPTDSPSRTPTQKPTSPPTRHPSFLPSRTPTRSPSGLPTASPSQQPTHFPSSLNPSAFPSKPPSKPPSGTPTTSKPTAPPSRSPFRHPTQTPTTEPSQTPSRNPSAIPTKNPSKGPTPAPSQNPSSIPTVRPTRPVAYVSAVISVGFRGNVHSQTLNIVSVGTNSSTRHTLERIFRVAITSSTLASSLSSQNVDALINAVNGFPVSSVGNRRLGAETMTKTDLTVDFVPGKLPDLPVIRNIVLGSGRQSFLSTVQAGIQIQFRDPSIFILNVKSTNSTSSSSSSRTSTFSFEQRNVPLFLTVLAIGACGCCICCVLIAMIWKCCENGTGSGRNDELANAGDYVSEHGKELRERVARMEGEIEVPGQVNQDQPDHLPADEGRNRAKVNIVSDSELADKLQGDEFLAVMETDALELEEIQKEEDVKLEQANNDWWLDFGDFEGEYRQNDSVLPETTKNAFDKF